MKLSELAGLFSGSRTLNLKEQGVTHFTADSRKVRPGSVFVAVTGYKVDGKDYVAEAAAMGACAVVTEKTIDNLPDTVAQILVPDIRVALSRLASEWNGNPSREMCVVGVTGTNGKTTTTFLLRSLLERKFGEAGLIGTVCYEIGSRKMPATNTTPGAVEMQSFLREMLNAGVDAVSMEVSSHALDQHRVDDIDFDVAVFTNLTRDHLDYHKTMDEYAAAKRKFFERLTYSGKGVLNADDPYFEYMAAPVPDRYVSYGIHADADVKAKILKMDRSGVDFNLITPAGYIPVHLPLIGRYNVSNALAAASAGIALDIDLETIKAALEACESVPGRLEKVSTGEDFTVLVDYAHTDDALKNVLTNLRSVTEGRLICVFGCGGDRDKGKRPLMGTTATELADHVVITSDNPRSEDPGEIIKHVLSGVSKGKNNFTVEPDRAKAVEAAVQSARAGDTVVLAGKGHETYQILKDAVIPFDDREVARTMLARRALVSKKKS